MTDGTVRRISKTYQGHQDISYVYVKVNMLLQRRSTYYTHLFVAPALVTNLILPFVFALPPESQEKLILGGFKCTA